MADTELVVDLARAETMVGEWDALAVARGQPMSSPAWMLAWWRHVAPDSAELRIVSVRDRGRLIGLVPLYVDLARHSTARAYRLLAHDFASVLGPLAVADREWEVAEATASLLAVRELRPDRLDLGPVPMTSPWAVALRERWPGRMRPVAYRRVLPVPIISIQALPFDVWLAGRSAKLRNNARRRQRRFADAGGRYRLANRESIEADVQTFFALHAERWEGRGRSRLVVLGERVPQLLCEVGNALLAEERFRLLLLELDGEPICAHLCLAAGGEVVQFNFGWDERYRHLSPPLLALLSTVEDACARRERRVDLGWGGNQYKEPFASGRDAVAWETLLPPGAQLVAALPRALPGVAGWRARQMAKRVLSDPQLSRLRELRATVARATGREAIDYGPS